MNPIKVTYLVVAAIIAASTFSGCAKKTPDIPKSTKNSYAKIDLANTSFGENFKLSQQLVGYLKKARILRNEGNHEEALENYRKADELSSDRVTKTMVNQGFAETYLLMNDYEKATLYFEKAADSTMNSKRAEEFQQKIEELRTK